MMLSNNCPYKPPCKSNTLAYEKVENVVNAPKSPMPKKCVQISLDNSFKSPLWTYANKSPRAKEPTTLTKNVAISEETCVPKAYSQTYK